MRLVVIQVDVDSNSIGHPLKGKFMTRIDFNDDIISCVQKLSEGNPGAISVLMQLMQAEDVDPDSAFGPFGTVLSLDTYGVYGSKIWILYKDLCGEDIVKTIATLRALQLGLVDHDLILGALTQDYHDPAKEPAKEFCGTVVETVQKELPNFAPQNATDDQG